MATIQFANGTKVQFNGTPTPADVEEVANKLGINNKPAEAPEKSLGQKILDTGTKVSDFFGGKGVADFLGGSMAKATVSKEQKPYVTMPTTKEVVGSALQLAPMLIPLGAYARGASGVSAGLTKLGAGKNLAKLGGEVITGAAAGAATDVGARMQTGEGGAPGTIIGAGLPLVPPVARKVLGGAFGKATQAVTPLTREQAFQNTQKKVLDTTGKVLQGTPKEQVVGARALTNIEKKGISTYEDLSKRLDESITKERSIVDAEFDAIPTPSKLSSLAKTLEVESGVAGKVLKGKVNYVEDALKQLDTLYKKTRDLQSSLKIRALSTKAKKVGLTPKEINALAREYGTEFKSKGFSKTGEALTTINDQAYENTRKGLKETARGFLKSKAAQQADERMADLLTTKRLVDKVAVKVNAAAQKIEKRNLIERIARRLGQGLDVATFGGPKAFVTKLLFPSGIGQKQMTYLEIQDALEKNLKTLDELTAAPDSKLEKVLAKLLGTTPSRVRGTKDFIEFPRQPGLSRADKEVEDRSIEKYLTQKEELKADYIKEHGNVVNTDLARRAFADVGYNGLNAAAVQEASSALAKDVWRELIAKNPQADVFLLAGGSGTGKSSAVAALNPQMKEQAAAILDGNLSGLASAYNRVEEAVNAGKNVNVVYVYREPVDAWINGVVKRMNTNVEEGGRVVPLSTFLENHGGSHSVVKNLLKLKGISVDLIDNSNGFGGQGELPLAKFNKITYNKEKLKSKLLEETKKLLDNGAITQEQYVALTK